jgi:hypothetical protein
MKVEALSSQVPTLLIYLPCYRDYQLAIKQAIRIRAITDEFPSDQNLQIKIMISVNGVELSKDSIHEIKEVSDYQVIYPFGISGDINITQGFMHAMRLNSEYLWILSANDAISDTSIQAINEKLVKVLEVDLLVGFSSNHPEIRLIKSVFDKENRDVPFGLISSVIYRTKRTANNFDAAVQLNWTGWGQLATIEASCMSRGGILVSLIEEQCLYIRSKKELDNSNDESNRIRNGYAHSFFGMPVVIGILFAQDQSTRKKLLNGWIRTNWYLVHFFLNTDFRLWDAHFASNQRWIRSIAFSTLNDASFIYRMLFQLAKKIKLEIYRNNKFAQKAQAFLKRRF